MSKIHNVAITLLFVNSIFSALGSELKDSEPVVINNKTVPIPPITEINQLTTTQVPAADTNTTISPNATTPTPVPPPKTTTTTEKPTTSTTTPPSPNSTSTTITPPTTVTTTKIPTTASTSTGTPNVTTTVKPTGTPPTTPVPSHRRFDGPSFIGGIVLALGLVAIGFVAFKFYKARTELNYHTL